MASNSIASLLDIRPGLTAIIGSGGKTTLMEALGRSLSRNGTVILSTTTKIFPPETIPILSGAQQTALRDALDTRPLLCVAEPHPSGKLVSPACSFALLASLADFVLVEADGSKHLPLKAHLPFEPVIPPESRDVVCVVGADGFGKPLASVCHRPEVFARLAGISLDTIVTPALAAQVIQKEGFAGKVLINKAETREDLENARRFAKNCSLPVFAGSLQKGELQCL